MEEYQAVISELIDELPQEFFRQLSGGVIVSDRVEIPAYAREGDLFTLGKYQMYSGVRQIVMYKGSFDRVYPCAERAEAKNLLRSILRHEFRRHLEYLAGIHDSTSLEAQDEREKRAYLAKHGG